MADLHQIPPVNPVLDEEACPLTETTESVSPVEPEISVDFHFDPLMEFQKLLNRNPANQSEWIANRSPRYLHAREILGYLWSHTTVDAELSDEDWGEISGSITDQSTDGGLAGLRLYMKAVSAAHQMGLDYEIVPSVQNEIQSLLKETVKDEKIHPPYPIEETLPLLAIYYPDLVYGSKTECTVSNVHDFNRDGICRPVGEGRYDYNVDSKIDAEDDWMLLEINRSHLGPHSQDIVNLATTFWQAEEAAGNPEALRHWGYWTGFRKITVVEDGVDPLLHYVTHVLESPDKISEDKVGIEVFVNAQASLSYEIKSGGETVASVQGISVSKEAGYEATLSWPKTGDCSLYELESNLFIQNPDGKEDIVSFNHETSPVWSPIFLEGAQVFPNDGVVVFQHNQTVPFQVAMTVWDHHSVENANARGLEKRSFTGKPLFQQTFTVDPSQKEVSLKWDPALDPHTVQEIRLVAYDPRFPKRYPGEELRHILWIPAAPFELGVYQIGFEPGSADIAQSADWEEQVSEISEKIQEILNRYPGYHPKLWIIGATDRVGSAEQNQTLSEKRAQALGAYFREEPLPVEIVYAGVGESWSQTEDNVDSLTDRRVILFLSPEPPIPGIDWKTF